MKDVEIQEWVRQARAGDRSAFTALVDVYWERIRRWLYGLTGDEHLAEDVTQEAFVKAWVALPTLQVEATFRVWLFRIARNCLLDQRRKQRGQPPAHLPHSLTAQDTDPLTALLDQEGQQVLKEALARLPVKQRAAYLLLVQEELTYDEIVAVLSIKPGAARARVYHARRLLVEALHTYLDLPTP